VSAPENRTAVYTGVAVIVSVLALVSAWAVPFFLARKGEKKDGAP
jgi:hypothetical protein